MEKNIKDYLHLYLGCDAEIVRVDDKLTHYMDSSWFGKKVGDVVSISPVILMCVNDKIVEIKPILRPLSDMGDEEFTECVLLHWGISRDIVEQKISKIERRKELKQDTKYGTAIPYSAFDKDGNHYMTGTVSSQSMSPEQTHYLLSKHFDLFSLIESGLAIDKTKMDI